MSLIESALKKLQSVQTKPTEDVGGTAPSPLLGELTGATGVAQSERHIRIDRDALRSAGLMPPEMQQRQLANQYRRIKRPLLANALGRGADKLPNGHLIMVASALPGEGKSYTTINLALSMALEKDITVILVDADLAKPHVSRSFGVVDEPGLVDALQDSAIDIESLVIPTDVPGLCILPAGAHVDTATELLASTRMQQVVARLSQVDKRRIVLFDSPPLLLTNESRVLTEVVGQVLVVVRAGVTARRAVIDAVSKITEGRAVSLVLNQAASGSEEGYYGYGEYGTYPEATIRGE